MIETEDLTQATTGSPDRLTLTTAQACELLQVSKPTLRAFIYREADPLPVFRYGRGLRIPRKSLEAWLERQTQEMR